MRKAETWILFVVMTGALVGALWLNLERGRDRQDQASATNVDGFDRSTPSPGRAIPPPPQASPPVLQDGRNLQACASMPLRESDRPVQYGWNFGNAPWCYSTGFSNETWTAYQNRPHSRTTPLSAFVNNPSDDANLARSIDWFEQQAARQGWDANQTVDFLLTFVQSLPYTSDNVTTAYNEYIRYPMQTLMEGGGDCEDTAILLAAFLKEMGYGVVLLSPPGHMAVGVMVSAETAQTMSTVVHDGDHYAFTETTGDGWRIGEIPTAYEESSIKVMPV